MESLDLGIRLMATQLEIDSVLGRTRAGKLAYRRVTHTERGAKARGLKNEVTGLTIADVQRLASSLVELGRTDDELGSVERGGLNDGRRHDTTGLMVGVGAARQLLPGSTGCVK